MAIDITRKGRPAWPALPPIVEWQDTCTTVHMWTQVIGKIRLELAPWINHSWGSTLYVSPGGLTTSAIPYEGGAFAIDFNFVDHELRVGTSSGDVRSVELAPMSVADFYKRTMQLLDDLNVQVDIYTRPVEVQEAIPFEMDERHTSYNAEAVHTYWRALVEVRRVLTEFRALFIGKASPVHFFWGAFDLAVTRFSGRTAPLHPGGIPNCPDWVMHEAYSHELSSAGFWPGTGLGEAAFYSYAYPSPDGFAEADVLPEAAYFHPSLGEFILPYEAVRASEDPDAALMAFLQTTYEAAAHLGSWDRPALERDPPARSCRRRHRALSIDTSDPPPDDSLRI